MTRLLAIDASQLRNLQPDDQCWHIGEYRVREGFNGETNNQILNLKKEPPVAANQQKWKQSAIAYWGDKLAEALDLAAFAPHVTVVPAPSSKIVGDPAYDDRMLQVALRLKTHNEALDVRLLIQTVIPRKAQHAGNRLSVDELAASMAVNREELATPIRQHVVILDDVFNQGGTFAAMTRLIRPFGMRPTGIFLAKAVWPSITS